MSGRKTLAGRRALVTGAAGPLGQVVARDLQDRGAYVIGIDRKAEAPTPFVDQMIEADLGAGSIPSMPPPEDDLDVVIHLAGRALPQDAGTQGALPERSVVDQTINDNFISVVDLVASTRPALGADSSITIVSSINSIRAFGLPIYSASKGAVNAFVIAIAPELLAEGVRINAIALGTVERADGNSRWPSGRTFRRLSRTFPDSRILTADEASQSILAVGVDSPGISGTVTVVDRGQSNFVNMGRL